MNGVARFAPYQVGASRLALDPIRFQASANGATNFDTAAVLDGPYPDGRVQAFRLPLNGQLGPGGAFSMGRGCIVTAVASTPMKRTAPFMPPLFPKSVP